MASTFHLFSLILLLLVLTNVSFNGALKEDEIQSMVNILRDSGYHLFGNAITTSEIFYEVLTGKSFTFFAPTDSTLFALDVWSPHLELGRSDSSSVPPSVEFSENDDPISFPPSDFGNFRNQNINNQYADSELGSLSDDGLLILPEDYVPIISQENLNPNPNPNAIIENSPEET